MNEQINGLRTDPDLRADRLGRGIHRPTLTEMIEDHLHRTLTLLDRVVLRHNLHPSQRRKRHQTRNGSKRCWVGKWGEQLLGGLGGRVSPVPPPIPGEPSIGLGHDRPVAPGPRWGHERLARTAGHGRTRSAEVDSLRGFVRTFATHAWSYGRHAPRRRLAWGAHGHPDQSGPVARRARPRPHCPWVLTTVEI